MAELIRITNHRPTLLHLPDLLVFDSSPEGPRVHGLGSGKSLIPGGNNIDKGYWEKIKGKVETWIKLKWITVGGDTSEKEGMPDPDSLVTFSQPDALTIIDTCDNMKSLKKWSLDVRQAVSEAAKRRMAVLAMDGHDQPTAPESPKAKKKASE